MKSLFVYFVYSLVFFSSHVMGDEELNQKWLDCAKGSLKFGHAIPFKSGSGSKGVFNQNAEGAVLNPDCAPDTLYSWQSSWAINKFKENTSKDKVLPLPKNRRGEKNLFLWRSPIGTIAYADYSIRVKLKKGVKFKFIGDRRFICKERTRFFNDKKVYVRFFRTAFGQEGSEYIICDSSPVESWSIGTREHYEEALRELNWILKNPPITWEPYIKTKNFQKQFKDNTKNMARFFPFSLAPSNNQILEISKTNEDEIRQAGLWDLYSLAPGAQLLGYNVDVDIKYWSKAFIFKRMMIMYREALKGEENIYAIHDDAKESHFETKFPTIFNPD